MDILSRKEVFEWKKNNLKLENFDFTVQLPSKCNEKYLIKMFESIEGVIDAEIIDIKQIDDLKTNFTFNYSVLIKKIKSILKSTLRE